MMVISSDQLFAFVVRASIEDGLGHLVRTLSVFKEMQPFVNTRLFVLGDESGQHLILESGISWVSCNSDEMCVNLLLEYSPQVVVFDTLHFEELAFDRVSCNVTTVSLSPVFSCMHKIDHLFHRTSYESPDWRILGDFPKIHKGLKYTVLPSWLRRVSTRSYSENLNEKRLSIAISMGGADAPNRTLALLKELSRYSRKFVVWVALGEAYTHSYENLLRCAKENRQEIILLKSNESMWRVLRNTSLIICAGGLTTYEAAYVGIPSVNILQTKNWSYLFTELARCDVCYVLNPAENSISEAASIVNRLVTNRGRLLDMHKSSKRKIPSGGAKRIAKKIITLKRKHEL